MDYIMSFFGFSHVKNKPITKEEKDEIFEITKNCLKKTYGYYWYAHLTEDWMYDYPEVEKAREQIEGPKKTYWFFN